MAFGSSPFFITGREGIMGLCMTQRGNAEPKALTPKQTFASGEKKGEMGKNHKRWGRIEKRERFGAIQA